MRSNLWGTGLLLPNIDDLERRWFSSKSCWAMDAWFGQGFLAVREDHFYGDLQVGYFRLQEPKVNFSGEVQVSYALISNFLIFSFISPIRVWK